MHYKYWTAVNYSGISPEDLLSADGGAKHFIDIINSRRGAGEMINWTFSTYENSHRDYLYVQETVQKLDAIIDIDFHIIYDDYYVQPAIDVRLRNYPGGDYTDLATPEVDYYGDKYIKLEINYKDHLRNDSEGSRRSAFIRVLGNALGLGRIGNDNQWSQDDSAMSYNKGSNGWRTWYSDSDLDALISLWGKENDTLPFYTDANSWRKDLNVNLELHGSGQKTLEAKQVTKNEFKTQGPTGSVITGGPQDEVIRGKGGWDILDGGAGNDLIHGGNGRDVITGGAGNDQLHGDFGWNTYKDLDDGYVDLICIKSDQNLRNHWFGKSGNNPDGGKCDIIEELDQSDMIVIIGGGRITYRDRVTHRGLSGIGIYGDGALEALYVGSALEISDIAMMTRVDNSDLAISNRLWSYGDPFWF